MGELWRQSKNGGFDLNRGTTDEISPEVKEGKRRDIHNVQVCQRIRRGAVECEVSDGAWEMFQGTRLSSSHKRDVGDAGW